MDQILRIVQGDLLRQHHRRPLAGAVARCRKVRDQALHAGRVDDPAPGAVDRRLAIEHLLEHVLAAEEHALGVDGHGLVVVLLARLVTPARTDMGALDAQARVVHHDVHPLVALHARPHRQLHVLRPRHVRLVVRRLSADLADAFVRAGLAGHTVVEVVGTGGGGIDRVARRRVQVDAEDRGPFGREGKADRLAQARGAACHDGNSTLEAARGRIHHALVCMLVERGEGETLLENGELTSGTLRPSSAVIDNGPGSRIQAMLPRRIIKEAHARARERRCSSPQSNASRQTGNDTRETKAETDVDGDDRSIG